jgi:hypothetical protein
VLFVVEQYYLSAMRILAGFEKPDVRDPTPRQGVLTTKGLFLSPNERVLTDDLIAYLNASRARDLLHFRVVTGASAAALDDGTGASAMSDAALDDLSEEFSRRVRRRPTIETVREFRIP